MKVLHVKHARADEKMFVPIPGAMTESFVPPPGLMWIRHKLQCGARIGQGALIYCGDVNAEDGPTAMTLALIGC